MRQGRIDLKNKKEVFNQTMDKYILKNYNYFSSSKFCKAYLSADITKLLKL